MHSLMRKEVSCQIVDTIVTSLPDQNTMPNSSTASAAEESERRRLAHVAEEIEDVGWSELHWAESYLPLILLHLLSSTLAISN